MNLFILSLNFAECAQFMFDKHVSKMILEAVQMLCTAIHLIDPSLDVDERLYKPTHKNHPVSIWIRESQANFIWTLNMIDAMHSEWKYRYNHPAEKIHKCYDLAMYLSYILPHEDKFPYRELTPFAQAMPDEYKHTDCVEAYRAYYQSPAKQKIASWKSPRNIPEWYVLQPPSLTTEIIDLPLPRPPLENKNEKNNSLIYKTTSIKIIIKIQKPKKF